MGFHNRTGFRKEIDNHMRTQKLYRNQILEDYLKKIISKRLDKIQRKPLRFKKQILNNIYDEKEAEVIVWKITQQKPCIFSQRVPTFQITRPDYFFKSYQYTFNEINEELHRQLSRIHFSGDLKLVVKGLDDGSNIGVVMYVVAN